MSAQKPIVIKSIIDHKYVDGLPQYLVKWENNGASAMTWESMDQISNKEVVESYNRLKFIKISQRPVFAKGILMRRGPDNAPEYLVQWDNYGITATSWEKPSSISNKEAIDVFNKPKPRQIIANEILDRRISGNSIEYLTKYDVNKVETTAWEKEETIVNKSEILLYATKVLAKIPKVTKVLGAEKDQKWGLVYKCLVEDVKEPKAIPHKIMRKFYPVQLINFYEANTEFLDPVLCAEYKKK